MNEQTRLARADPRAPFTAEDFLRMVALGAFADMRAELVRGEIEKMMPADWTHGELYAAVVALIYPLARSIDARTGGDVVLRINEQTVRAPDISMVRPGLTPDKVLQGSDVLLAIEIADTTLDRDMGAKRIDYATAGIPNYWVVDANRKVVHRFIDPVDGDYAQVTTFRFDEPIPVPGTDATLTID